MKKKIWEKEIGTIQNIKDSVLKAREIRKKLSKERFNLEEINNLLSTFPHHLDNTINSPRCIFLNPFLCLLPSDVRA